MQIMRLQLAGFKESANQNKPTLWRERSVNSRNPGSRRADDRSQITDESPDWLEVRWRRQVLINALTGPVDYGIR